MSAKLNEVFNDIKRLAKDEQREIAKEITTFTQKWWHAIAGVAFVAGLVIGLIL